MKKIIVNGPCRLEGEVTISGAKNAAVAILPATLLVKGKCHLDNVPDISDIRAYYQILESLGSKIEYISKNEVIIDNTEVTSAIASYELTSKFRASYYLIGSLLGRFDNVQISLPGGCNLGARPIDQHIKGNLGLFTVDTGFFPTDYVGEKNIKLDNNKRLTRINVPALRTFNGDNIVAQAANKFYPPSLRLIKI